KPPLPLLYPRAINPIHFPARKHVMTDRLAKDVPSERANGEQLPKTRSRLRLAAETWREEQATRRAQEVAAREERRELWLAGLAAESAAQERENYRKRRAAEGKTVRAYKRHQHEPMKKTETYEDFQRRCHNQRQREYSKAKSALTRTRADLSMLTEAERAERRRIQQNARKQKQRL